MSESNDFQLTVKAENKEDLAHDYDQEMKETKKDIKYSFVILEEDKRKDNEYFLSHVEYLEQQEDLVIESSNKTIRSCDFKNGNVNVLAGYAEDCISFEVVLSEVGGWKETCQEECLVGKDTDEVL